MPVFAFVLMCSFDPTGYMCACCCSSGLRGCTALELRAWACIPFCGAEFACLSAVGKAFINFS